MCNIENETYMQFCGRDEIYKGTEAGPVTMESSKFSRSYIPLPLLAEDNL